MLMLQELVSVRMKFSCLKVCCIAVHHCDVRHYRKTVGWYYSDHSLILANITSWL